MVFFLLLLLSILPVHITYAAEYLVGVGFSSPFVFQHSPHRTTNANAITFDLTQYPLYSSWGALGFRESVWMFPSIDGIAGGAGPAGELHYSPAPEVLLFVTASGSIGGSNLSSSCPEVSGTIQFGGQAGIGLEVGKLRLELRYQHLSNGGTSLPNLGLDMIAPVVSYRF
jgi:hypothetical protein